MSTNIYLIRHAEAEGNLYRRVHGHTDSNITELGLRQIEALRERFADVQIDALYSSDLVRARSTARAIGVPRGMETVTTPRLREVNMGHWEDSTWAALERSDAEQLALYSRDPARWDIGTNESYESKVRRITDVVTELAEAHPNETICIVSHGCMIRTLLAAIMRIPSERINEIAHCDNTGVSLFEYADGEFKIHYMNDASHLTEETSTFARQSWWKNSDGKDTGNVHYVPFDLHRDADRYLTYRREAWQSVHGSLDGYTDDYLELAQEHQAAHPNAVVEAYLGDVPIGVLELDPTCGADTGAGAISFFYVRPEYRNRGLGVQLIGHAISVYRKLGREKLTLRVAETNTAAIGFYERFGFHKTHQIPGALVPLWVMEMDIRVRVR